MHADRLASLRRLFDPSSIAVVGVSAKEASFGSRAFKNLAGFDGRLYAVNSQRSELFGHRCYPSVAAIPEIPDCVIVAVPQQAVEEVVMECARLGVGGVVIFASGYSETQTAEKVMMQTRLTEIAATSRMRILGPNCMGYTNFVRRSVATFSANEQLDGTPGPSAIGLVSQSGALGFGLAQAMHRGIRFSHVFSVGNACDVDIADQITFLAEEPSCAAIACLFESTPEPLRFFEAARRALRNGKQIVVFKLGRSDRGAAAAMSHTGMLAGSIAAFEAAFARAGIVQVDRLEHLLETTAFFAKAPPCRSDGVAVFSVSGGTAIMAADEAEFSGIDLPQPAIPAHAVLALHVPDFGSTTNPFDVTAVVANDPAKLTACAGALMADPCYGALVVPHPSVSAGKTSRIASYSELAQQHDKPVCIVWTSGWLEGPGASDTEADPRVAVFRSMRNCFDTLAAWQVQARHRGQDQPARHTGLESKTKAATLIASSTEATLTESLAKEVLASYGVPVVREILARSLDEALAAGVALGYPLVAKIQSPDIPHKTEAGVVRLNIRTEQELLESYDALLARAQAFAPGCRIDGVLVQPMVGAGAEILIGATIDPQLGPLIVVGLGGVLVELVRDTVLELAPVTPRQADEMLGRLHGKAIFDGFRGAPPLNRAALAGAISRVSELIADHAGEIVEIDVNPLICGAERIVAVDALIVRKRHSPVY